MARKVSITKEFTFDAAHKLEWHQGKCKNLHGHTYKLQVTIKAELNKDGIVMDFIDLKSIISKEVIEVLDHSYLNDLIENPTAENIVVWIWDRLKNNLKLDNIQLWETPSCYVTYSGD